jgi:hypothetical protein
MAETNYNNPFPATSAPRFSLALARSLFVWATWAAVVEIALWYVATHARNIPWMDDWEMVPVMTGNQPLTPAWLWEQHNEHRIPVPKLLLRGLLAVSGNDFRAGMIFNIVALALLAAAMILVAKRLRGATAWWDAFFPLILFHGGHAENLLWSWQLEFVLSTLLDGIVLLLIARQGEKMTRATVLGTACCLVLLPLTGANGFVLVPPLALWLVYAVAPVLISRDPSKRTDRIVALGALGAVLIPAVAYGLGYERVARHPESPSVGVMLETSLECLSMGFGFGLKGYWLLGGLGMFGLILVGAGILVGVLRWRPEEHRRALGLLMVLVATLGLALAIGWGRASSTGHGGLMARYCTLMTPGLCCVYLILVVYVPARFRGWAQGGLFLLAFSLFGFNLLFALEYGAMRLQIARGFQKNVGNGFPPVALASHYTTLAATVYPDPERLTTFLRMLRDARIEPYRRLQEDPDVRPLPLTPEEADFRPDGIYAFRAPRHVVALQVTYHLEKDVGVFAGMSVHWVTKDRLQRQVERTAPTFYFVVSPGERTVTIWINDVVERLWLVPDNKAEMPAILNITLLVPPPVDTKLPAIKDGAR